MKAALVAVLSLLLAGCTTPSDELRTDNLFVQVIADGAWTLETPLPIGGGADADFWMSELRISIGSATLAFDEASQRLVIRGNGSIDLEALTARKVVDADAFMDGTWTVPPEAGQLQVIVGGSIDQFTITHNANSCRGRGCDAGAGPANQVCDRNQVASASGLKEGVRRVPLQDGSRCTKAP